MSQVRSKSDATDKDSLYAGSEKKEKSRHSKHINSKENGSINNNVSNNTETGRSANSSNVKERNNRSSLSSNKNQSSSHSHRNHRKKPKKSPSKANEQPENLESNEDQVQNSLGSKKQSKVSDVENSESNQKSKKVKTTKASSRSSKSSKSKSSTSNGSISSSFFDELELATMTSDEGTTVTPRTRLLILREKHKNKNKNAKRAIGNAEKREHRFTLRPLKQSTVIQQQEQKLQSPKVPSNPSNESPNHNNSVEKSENQEIVDSLKQREVNEIINREKEISPKKSQEQNGKNNDFNNKEFSEEEENQVNSAKDSEENKDNADFQEEEEENEVQVDINENARKSPRTPNSRSPSRSPKNGRQFTLHTYTDENVQSEGDNYTNDNEEEDASIIEDSEVVIVPHNSPTKEKSKEKGIIIDLSISQSGTYSGSENERLSIRKNSSSPVKSNHQLQKKKKKKDEDNDHYSGHRSHSSKKGKSLHSIDEDFQPRGILKENGSLKDDQQIVNFDSSSRKGKSKSISKSGKSKSNEKKNRDVAEEKSVDFRTIDAAPVTQTIADNSAFKTVSLLFDKKGNQVEHSSGEKKSNFEFPTMGLEFEKVYSESQFNEQDQFDQNDAQSLQTIPISKKENDGLYSSASNKSYTYEYATFGYVETDGSTTSAVLNDSQINSEEAFNKRPVNRNIQNEDYSSFQSDNLSHTYTYVAEYVEEEEVKENEENEYEYEYVYETVEIGANKKQIPDKANISTKQAKIAQNKKSNKQFSFVKPVLETFQDVTIPPFYQEIEEEEDNESTSNLLNSSTDYNDSIVNQVHVNRDINIFESNTSEENIIEEEEEYEYEELSNINSKSGSIIKSGSKPNSNNNSSIKSNSQNSNKKGSIKSNSRSNSNNNSLIRFGSKIKSSHSGIIKSKDPSEISSLSDIKFDNAIKDKNIQNIESDVKSKTEDKEQNNDKDEQELEADTNSNSFSSFDLAPSKKILEMKKELARLLNSRQNNFTSQQNQSSSGSHQKAISKSRSASSVPKAQDKIESQGSSNSNKAKPNQLVSNENEEESTIENATNSPKRANSPARSNQNLDQLDSSSAIIGTFPDDHQVNDNKEIKVEAESSSISQEIVDRSFSGLIEVLQGVSSGSSFAPKSNQMNQDSLQESVKSFEISSQNDELPLQQNNNENKEDLIQNQKEREIQIKPEKENQYSEIIQEEESEGEVEAENLMDKAEEEEDNEIESGSNMIPSIIEDEIKEKEEIRGIENQEEKEDENEEEENKDENQIILHIDDDDQNENERDEKEDEDENEHEIQNQSENEPEPEFQDENEIELQNVQREQAHEEEEECQIYVIKPEDLPGIKPNMFPPFRFKKKKSSDYDDSDYDDDSDDSDQTYPFFDPQLSKKKSVLTSPYYQPVKSTEYPITSLNVCIVEASLQTAVSSFVQLGIRENSKGRSHSKVNEEDTVKTKIVRDTFLPRYNERFNVPIEDPETDELSLKIFAVTNSTNSKSPKQSVISQVYVATNMFPLNKEVVKTFQMTPTGKISLKVTAESELYNQKYPKTKTKNEKRNKINDDEIIKSETDEEMLQIKIDLDDDEVENKEMTKPKEKDSKIELKDDHTEEKDDQIELDYSQIEENDDDQIEEKSEQSEEKSEQNEEKKDKFEEKKQVEYDDKDEYEYIEEDDDDENDGEADIEIEVEGTLERKAILNPVVNEGQKSNDEDDEDEIETDSSILEFSSVEMNDVENTKDKKGTNSNDDDDAKVDSDDNDGFDNEEEDEVSKLSPVDSGYMAEPLMMNLQQFHNQDDDDDDFDFDL